MNTRLIIIKAFSLTYNWNRATCSIRIACVPRQAGTHWNMIGNLTFRIDSARSRTRIDAFVTNAALITRTVIIQNAFGSTRAVRIADVIRRTDARNRLALLTALGVASARMSIAWSRFGLYDAWFHCNISMNIYNSKRAASNRLALASQALGPSDSFARSGIDGGNKKLFQSFRQTFKSRREQGSIDVIK